MYRTKLTGVSEALEKLDKLSDRQQAALTDAITETAEEIMTDSKENYCPVDTGALRSTGHVQEPEVSETAVSVDLGYGGQAIGYAPLVHEDMDAVHTVGQAKYLEVPFRQRIRLLGRRMKAALAEGMK